MAFIPLNDCPTSILRQELQKKGVKEKMNRNQSIIALKNRGVFAIQTSDDKKVFDRKPLSTKTDLQDNPLFDAQIKVATEEYVLSDPVPKIEFSSTSYASQTTTNTSQPSYLYNQPSIATPVPDRASTVTGYTGTTYNVNYQSLSYNEIL